VAGRHAAIEAMPRDAERARRYERARFIAATLYMLAPGPASWKATA
jgi:hypothetical protein